MRRVSLLCLILVVPLAGCFPARPAPATSLTMLAVNSFVGRSLFHLDCAPVSGGLPNPARACAALTKKPQLVTKPKPFVCAGGTFSWWDITISGRLNGKPVYRAFSTCWTPQMATLGRFGMTWAVLRKHLLPRRHEAVLAGTTRTFTPGTLRPADLVTCDIRGHQLTQGVPNNPGPGASTGYSGANIVAVTLTVALRPDGSVTASCHTQTPTPSRQPATFSPPAWLTGAERSLLTHTFGNANPTHVDYIPYPKKIAVIFQFDHFVVCGPCGHPFGVSPLGGRVIRVAFDRRTHQMFGAPRSLTIRFCEVTVNKPPKRVCLHR